MTDVQATICFNCIRLRLYLIFTLDLIYHSHIYSLVCEGTRGCSNSLEIHKFLNPTKNVIFIKREIQYLFLKGGVREK